MPPAPKSQRRRRWFALALVLLVLLGLWLVRSLLLGPIVARVVANAIGDAVGGQASIGAASGGWFGDARFSDVSIAAERWSLTAQRIEALYGLRLLRGDVTALRRVSIAGLRVEAQLGDASGESAEAGQAGSLPTLPAVLPELQVDGQVVLHLADEVLQLDGVVLAVHGDRLELEVTRIALGDRSMRLPRIVLVRTAPDTLRLEDPVLLAVPGLHAALRWEQLELTVDPAALGLAASGSLGGGSWRVQISPTATNLSLQGVDIALVLGLPAASGPLPVDAVLDRTDDGWAMRSLRVSGAGVSMQASATIRPDPWRCDDLVAEFAADLPAMRRSLPGMPALVGLVQASLSGHLPLDPHHWRDADLSLAVTGQNLVLAGQTCAPLRLEARMADGDITLHALEATWAGLAFSLGEASPAPVARSPADTVRLLARPIRVADGTVAVAARRLEDGTIAGEVRLDRLHVAKLPGADVVRHLTGDVSGLVSIGGRIEAPTWSGSLQADRLEVKFSPDVPVFAAGRARLTLSPGILSIDSLIGELGGAAVEISGRVTDVDGARQVSLSCRGDNLLLLQRPDARVRADLDLRLEGDLARPQLSGSVVVGNALFTPELQLSGGEGADGLVEERLLLFELPDPPWSQMRFDVRIGSRVVSDSDPDAGVRVVTRWGRGMCDLDLRLGGTGAAPAPRGRVALRKAVATLPFSTLRVSHGELIFPTDNPFQPQLAVSAGARVRQYDVQVRVSGPLAHPTVNVTGSGLDEQEAMLLLTTGSTPRELQDPNGQKAALGRVGAWLGQEAWRTWDADADPDGAPSLTERVTVEWGRELTTQGRDTIETEVELTEPGSTQAVLLFGERDRYDQYNAGILFRFYWGGEDPP